MEERWAWLALPLVILFSSLPFLLTIVWYTLRHEAPLWKSSLLATLYHGLDGELMQPGRIYNSHTDAADAARVEQVCRLPRNSKEGYYDTRATIRAVRAEGDAVVTDGSAATAAAQSHPATEKRPTTPAVSWSFIKRDHSGR